RRRFGHWNYHADYGSSFLFAGEGGTISTAGGGLRVLGLDGTWVPVPADLQQAGTGPVSALAPPALNFRLWSDRPEKFGLNAGHRAGAGGLGGILLAVLEVIGLKADSGAEGRAEALLEQIRLIVEQDQQQDPSPGLLHLARHIPIRALRAA